MNALHHALEYRRRGWMPVPLGYRKKAIFLKDWPNLRLTEDELPQHFQGRCNVGVLLGEPSGWLVDVDLDNPVAVELAPEYLPATGRIFGRTSKPRSHWLYRTTAPCSNYSRSHEQAGDGHDKTIVEIRSTGEQTVFPGSVHESGEDIFWDEEGEPEEIDPAYLRECVDRLADAVLARKGIVVDGLRDNEPLPPPNSFAMVATPGDRPGDDYNRRGDVRQLLLKHGWQPVGMQGESEKWRRPGKTEGVSGSLLNGAFYCYTTSTVLKAKKAYAPFDLLAALEFNNDFTAAARWLRQQGYGADEPDISRIVNGQPACAVLDADPAKPPQKSALPKIVTYTPRGDDEPAPKLRKPVINGIAREGETINIIAPPKIGKSWAVLDLAFSVSTGAGFLNTPEFRTTPGNVLILDNELHEETLEYRIATVQRSGRFTLGGHKRIDYVSLRGKLANILQLDELFNSIDPDEYKLIVIDALYRCLPEGTDENDNGGMARIYNLIDKNAMRLNCVFAIIHHTSKGGQGSKAVTDVGAGAGSQSRATDAHLILRHHEEEGAMVLDAACRSFAPITPHAYRWQYPLWIPAPDLDATKLKVDRPKGKQSGGELSVADLEGKASKVRKYLAKKGPQSKSSIAGANGMNGNTAGQVLAWMEENGEVAETPSGRGNYTQWVLKSDKPYNPDKSDLYGKGASKTDSLLGESVCLASRSNFEPAFEQHNLSGLEEEFPE